MCLFPRTRRARYERRARLPCPAGGRFARPWVAAPPPAPFIGTPAIASLPPPAPDYTLRAATAADFAFVAALNARSDRDVVERQFGHWDPAYQAENFERKWRRGTHRLILRHGQPIGAFRLEAMPDHLFRADTQIDTPARRRGIGAAVLAALIAEARARRLPLRLRVLHRNRARTLYERLGFRQYGIMETHFLMEKAF